MSKKGVGSISPSLIMLMKPSLYDKYSSIRTMVDKSAIKFYLPIRVSLIHEVSLVACVTENLRIRIRRSLGGLVRNDILIFLIKVKIEGIFKNTISGILGGLFVDLAVKNIFSI